MSRDKLEVYYNKFNEDKRLTRRHGKVEFITSMKYIHKVLENYSDPKILDIGAGTGRYSIALADEGFDVSAIELLKCNLNVLKEKSSKVKAHLGNALNLGKFKDNSFDVTLLFGPMYHLATKEEKIIALNEAKRVTKPNGTILVAYVMNEYGVLTYAFKEHNAIECKNDGRLNEQFHCIYSDQDLYSFVRIEEIDEINNACKLTRKQIISADGPANYMRQTLNQMSDEEFDLFINYHLSTCERLDLIGACAHTVDILIKDQHKKGFSQQMFD